MYGTMESMRPSITDNEVDINVPLISALEPASVPSPVIHPFLLGLSFAAFGFAGLAAGLAAPFLWYHAVHPEPFPLQGVLYADGTLTSPAAGSTDSGRTDLAQILLDGALPRGAVGSYVMSGGWDVQINQSYCGAASAAALLNSLGWRSPGEYLRYQSHAYDGDPLPIDRSYEPYPYATQHDVFDGCTNSTVIRMYEDFDGILHTPGGLSLRQIAGVLRCSLAGANGRRISGAAAGAAAGATVEYVHADIDKEMFLDKLRTDVTGPQNGTTTTRVLVNYSRRGVGQVGGGHFSPIAGYHPGADAFLVLDVAKYKYPAAWIPADMMYDAAATEDMCGVWDWPDAQDPLPTDATIPELKVMLGCKVTMRGYIVVKVPETTG